MPAISSHPSVEKQIQILIELTDGLRATRQTAISGADLPAEFREKLAQLSSGLNNLRRQAAENTLERDNLLALAHIGQVVNSSLKLDDVLRIVMDTIVRLTGAERGFLMLRDAQSEFSIRIARNWEQETVEAGEFAISRTVVNRVVAEGQPILTTNAQEDPRFDSQASIIAYNLRSILCVPLKVKGELIGVIYADNRMRTGLFSEAQRDLLAAFSDQAAVAIDNARLFETQQRLTEELAVAYDSTLVGWARALELRDKETEGHTQRVTEMTEQMGRAVGMGNEELLHVRRGALLHDMGKMGIPDAILHKPGPLNDEEWAIMRQHPFHAYTMLSPIDFLKPALDIPYCHHEKLDGSGYPQGLREGQIPLGARLFAIVDVWDALISDRVYRKAWPKDKALSFVREQSGRHFDPTAVETLAKVVG